MTVSSRDKDTSAAKNSGEDRRKRHRPRAGRVHPRLQETQEDDGAQGGPQGQKPPAGYPHPPLAASSTAVIYQQCKYVALASCRIADQVAGWLGVLDEQWVRGWLSGPLFWLPHSCDARQALGGKATVC